jgi:molybdopterin-guanine dinucleotide biosynthesis protein B
VVAISGRSGAGKTTLIEQLLPLLAERGLRVVTLKHAHCLAEVDVAGKDTWRHRHAGAARVVLEGRGARAVFEPAPEGRATAGELAARFAADADLVLAEGFRGEALARVEVVAEGERALLAPAPGATGAASWYRVAHAPRPKPDADEPPQWDVAALSTLADELARLVSRPAVRRLASAS